MHIYAVRIDLRAGGVRVRTTRGNGELPLDANSMRVTSILEQEKWQVAINGSAFAPTVDDEGVPQDIVGLSLRDGEVLSETRDYFGGLLCSEGVARIGNTPFDMTGVTQGLQGFEVVLQDGKICVDPGGDLHPRSAAGVSADGHVLYLVAIDGRQPGVSEGATTYEIGAILKDLGADDALNLDGGGSTALVIADESGKPKLLNVPIHRGVPMNQRPVANAIGVIANKITVSPK